MTFDSHRAIPSDNIGGSLQIREGAVADAEGVEEVHYASREARYGGRTTAWPPPGPDQKGRVERWRTWLGSQDIVSLVGVVDEEIVGFCTIRASQDEDADPERVAEMPTLYVSPGAWGRGYGAALCRAGLERAQLLGFSELTLWVLAINEAAQGFYRAFGFTGDGATKVDEATREHLVAHRFRIGIPGTGA